LQRAVAALKLPSRHSTRANHEEVAVHKELVNDTVCQFWAGFADWDEYRDTAKAAGEDCKRKRLEGDMGAKAKRLRASAGDGRVSVIVGLTREKRRLETQMVEVDQQILVARLARIQNDKSTSDDESTN
jgi:hypothetical protein